MPPLKRCGNWGSKEETGLYSHMIWWRSYDFHQCLLTKALIYPTSHSKAMPFTACLGKGGKRVTLSVPFSSDPQFLFLCLSRGSWVSEFWPHPKAMTQ